MGKEKAAKLIHKYFYEEELTERELEELLTWLKIPGNKKMLEDQIELDYSLGKTDKGFDTAKAYREIESQLKSDTGRPKNWTSLLKKYAAVFILLLGMGYLLFTLGIKNPVENNSSSITLKSDGGRIKTLDLEDKEIILNSEGKRVGTWDGNSLIYEKDTTSTELVYNTLHIPRGKTFKVQLSEGTKIVLNADTEITFPINFLPNKERKVRLQGEAYFEVTKDSLRPFITKTDGQEIRVYGTIFNVKAYLEDRVDETVLVEGSVGVNTQETEVKLVPGEMARTKKGEGLKVESVNVNDYVSWVQDKLVFQSDRFGDILKVLERKFDVEIENTYVALNDERFTAQFDKDKDLVQILQLFSESRSFEFNKEGNHVTISQSKP